MTSAPDLNLANPPIVEAILDIECSMPTGFKIEEFAKPATEAYKKEYPGVQTQFMQHHTFKADAEGKIDAQHRQNISGYRFLQADQKQLVQLRTTGFSFNRLAPYTHLAEYLPEIRRTWEIFRELTAPDIINSVQLRYINQIHIPVAPQGVNLNEYFRTIHHLLDDETMAPVNLFSQQGAIDKKSDNHVNLVLATQAFVGATLPVVLDITVSHRSTLSSGEWDKVLEIINDLRVLKNHVFMSTLSEKCFQLFQ